MGSMFLHHQARASFDSGLMVCMQVLLVISAYVMGTSSNLCGTGWATTLICFAIASSS